MDIKTRRRYHAYSLLLALRAQDKSYGRYIKGNDERHIDMKISDERFNKPIRRRVSNGGVKRPTTSVQLHPRRLQAMRELATRLTKKLGHQVSQSVIINDALDGYEPLNKIEAKLIEEQENGEGGDKS